MSQCNKCKPLCFLVHTATLWAVALSLGSPKVFFFPPSSSATSHCISPSTPECSATLTHAHSQLRHLSTGFVFLPFLSKTNKSYNVCTEDKRWVRAIWYDIDMYFSYGLLFLSGHKLFLVSRFSFRLAYFFSFPVINRLIPAISSFFLKQCSASWYVTS